MSARPHPCQHSSWTSISVTNHYTYNQLVSVSRLLPIQTELSYSQTPSEEVNSWSSWFQNFRAVSNLSFRSKVIEQAVAAQLLKHLEKNNLLDKMQSAWKGGHSTHLNTAWFIQTVKSLSNSRWIRCNYVTKTSLLYCYHELQSCYLVKKISSLPMKFLDTATLWYILCGSQIHQYFFSLWIIHII